MYLLVEHTGINVLKFTLMRLKQTKSCSGPQTDSEGATSIGLLLPPRDPFMLPFIALQ